MASSAFIIPKPQPTPGEVALTISKDEAEQLRGLIGSLSAFDGYLDDVFDALSDMLGDEARYELVEDGGYKIQPIS